MRLNAYLARAGICSRRGADELITQGRVRVNGEVAALATVVSESDTVELDGKPLGQERLVTVLLHKPPGVVSTARDPQGRPTVVDLVRDVGVRVVPVGRLDADTTGALLLTNDGQLANSLAHPRFEVDKVYEAFLRGIPTDDTLRKLEQGVELEDGRTAPAKVRRLARSVVELTIHEGRNRQVKRMCEAVGHRVVRLHRSRYAGLDLAGLAVGEWRRLSAAEVDRLRDVTARQAEQAATRAVARTGAGKARPTAPRLAPTSPGPSPARAPRSGRAGSGTSERRDRPSP